MRAKIYLSGGRQTAFRDMFGIDLRVDPIERAGQIGRLCGIAATLLRSSHPVVPLLRRADRDEAALAQAVDAIAALPSLTRRRLIASFGATEWTRPVAKARREPGLDVRGRR
jgi:hypothetical protein